MDVNKDFHHFIFGKDAFGDFLPVAGKTCKKQKDKKDFIFHSPKLINSDNEQEI